MSPNPTTGQFVISSTEFADKNSLIEIFNTLGEKIYSVAYRDGSTVNCEHFRPGIYFVRLGDSEKQLIQKLVVE
ncbi:MAG: T9SS type A sorting domain-containing protein [Bacteroidetes bacterium]|nr:T9SS type A sorting domain-containing protein [Bacteroidota bacterium]